MKKTLIDSLISAVSTFFLGTINDYDSCVGTYAMVPFNRLLDTAFKDKLFR